uniref:Uncharacterized protein n=1 Tax=Ackermannviridae sp. TaxID=2831612 RepID=A0A8S5VJ32_9CAUD|nr:MAG TPA: hypothetical protein [Ackermannviridae sp.]
MVSFYRFKRKRHGDPGCVPGEAAAIFRYRHITIHSKRIPQIIFFNNDIGVILSYIGVCVPLNALGVQVHAVSHVTSDLHATVGDCLPVYRGVKLPVMAHGVVPLLLKVSRDFVCAWAGTIFHGRCRRGCARIQTRCYHEGINRRYCNGTERPFLYARHAFGGWVLALLICAISKAHDKPGNNNNPSKSNHCNHPLYKEVR